MAVVVVVAGFAAVFLAQIGGAAIARARARTAADAAALAGAAGGRSAADAIARANGAALSTFTVDGSDTEVGVDVGAASATARAEASSGATAAGGGDREGLAPVMLAALRRADALLGHPVPVVSGFRSAAEQAWLWAHRATNPYPVAEPGTSMHERGLAVDVVASEVPALLRVAAAAGLCQPLPSSDPIHFEPCQLSSPR
jgi:hypothetical protein